MAAYKTGERQEVGKIAFEFYSGTLWMVLPSGRRLAYLKPRQQPNRFGRMSLTYEGVGQNHSRLNVCWIDGNIQSQQGEQPQRIKHIGGTKP